MGDLTSWIGIFFQTIAIMVSMGAFILRLHMDLKLLIQRQEHMQREQLNIQSRIEKLGQVVIDLAKQDTRLNNVEARLQEMSLRLFDHIRKDEAA